MIKGIALGATIAAFITSIFLAFAGYSNALKENIFTGAVIGSKQLASYSIVVAIISFIIGLAIIVYMKKY